MKLEIEMSESVWNKFMEGITASAEADALKRAAEIKKIEEETRGMKIKNETKAVLIEELIKEGLDLEAFSKKVKIFNEIAGNDRGSFL